VDAGAALYRPTPGLEDWEQGLISIRKLDFDLKFDSKFLPDTPIHLERGIAEQPIVVRHMNSKI
jgi:hypothetical protein